MTWKAGLAIALTSLCLAGPALAQGTGGGSGGTGGNGAGTGGTSGGGSGPSSSPGGGSTTPGAPTAPSAPGSRTPGSPGISNPSRDPHSACPPGQSRPKTNQPCQPTTKK